MVTASDLDEYLAEIRARVCSRCIERPPHGPPCGPLGKRCGIELHLPAIVGVAQSSRSRLIDPYMEAFHRDVCAHCTNQPTSQCPCPLDYLLLLAIEAIDAVDARRGGGESDA